LLPPLAAHALLVASSVTVTTVNIICRIFITHLTFCL
jgi:hypothetical protein